MAPQNPNPSLLDPGQIIKRAFDESEDRIRVITDANVISGAMEVAIDAASGDNIAISDGTDTLDVNSDGSINVNVISSDVELGAVEIKDGTTNTRVTVKSDGVDNAMVVTQNSQPLPTGASTAARQDTGNTSLASIDTKLTDKSQFTKLTDGTDTALITASGELNVLSTAQPGVDIGDVTVNNAAGASAVNIQDGGNSITVDGTVAATQSGTWNINNITGTVSLPTGAATEASLAKLTQTQGSTTSGQSGPLVQGAVTTAAPTYSNAQTSPLSLTTGGALRTDSSATTQPVSGTVTANQGTSPWVSNISQFGGSNVVTGTGNSGAGIPRVTVSNDSSITNISGTISLPTGASTSALQTTGNTSLASIDTKLTDKSQFTKITDGTDTALVTAAGEINVLATAQPGVDIGDVTINNTSGAGAVNIQDGGNSITVDGTVSASNFPSTVDTNYGTVGANTIRTAAEIGNATGAAAFNAGTTTAQVLRVVLPTDQTVIPVSDNAGSLTVDQPTASNLNAQVVGNVAAGATDSGNPVKVGGKYNTSLPTLTDGQRGDIQLDSNSRQIISPLTNASVVKAQLQDNSGVGITSHYTSGTDRGIDVGIVDGPQVDSYNRLRVAEQDLVFAAHFANTLNTLNFNTSVVGSATLTSVTNQAAARLSTTTGATDSIIVQTKRYLRYTPGVSHQIMIATIVGAQKTNVRQRWGYFDTSDGLFFEQTSADRAVVVRSSTTGSIVDTRVTQPNWNLDKLDGTGTSGVTLDTTKHNVYIIDYVWQGAGRTRFGIMFDRGIVYFHEILNANVNTSPYMRTPSRPGRAELTNTGATASTTNMDVVCVFALRETSDKLLAPFAASASRGTTAVNVSTIKPLISLRPKSTFNSITNRIPIVPQTATIITTNQAILVQVYLNATLTGASFTSAGTNSGAEYDVTATAVSGGTLILETYISSQNFDTLNLAELADNAILGLDIAGSVQDTLTISATSLAGGTSTWAQIAWQEFQ